MEALRTALFEMMPDPLGIVDQQHRFVSLNERAQRIFAPATPSTLHDLFDMDHEDHEWLRMARGTTGWVPTRFRLKNSPDDAHMQVEISGLKSGQYLGHWLIRFFARPVMASRFRDLQDDLAKQKAEAVRERHKRQQTEAMNEALKRFAGIAAHDLISPMASIASGLSLLDMQYADTMSPDSRNLMAEMRNSLDRLTRQIRGLMEHTHSINEPLVKEDVSLESLIREVCQDLSAHIQTAEAQVTLGTLPTVRAHWDLIYRVFSNLVGNACKYRHPDRGLLLRLEAIPRDDGICVKVRDNGRGFSQAMAEEMFRPFHRLNHGGDVEGSGLGLATVKSVIDRHGWSITAEGTVGVGACFCIGVPGHDLVSMLATGDASAQAQAQAQA